MPLNPKKPNLVRGRAKERDKKTENKGKAVTQSMFRRFKDAVARYYKGETDEYPNKPD